MNYTIAISLIESMFDIKHAMLVDSDMSKVILIMCNLIAAICCIIYIISVSYKSNSEGEPIPIARMIKPMIIVFSIGILPHIVTVIDDFACVFSYAITTQAKELRQDKQGYIDAITVQIITNKAKEKSQTEPTDWSAMNEIYKKDSIDLVDKGSSYSEMIEVEDALNSGQSQAAAQRLRKGPTIKNVLFGWLYNNVAKTTDNIVLGIPRLLSQVASPIIGALAVVYLTILSLLAPIIFALSLIPAFNDNIPQFFARYIQISLWIPLAGLVEIIMAQLEILRYKARLAGEISPFSIDFPSLLIYIICIIAVFKVPTIAGWIVQSAGAGSLNSSVNRGASAAASAGGKGTMKTISKKVITKA